MPDLIAGYATQGAGGMLILSLGMHRYRISAQDVAALLTSDARVQVYREYLHTSDRGFGTYRYQYAGYVYADVDTQHIVVDLRWPMKGMYCARILDLERFSEDPADRIPLFAWGEGSS